MAGENDDLNSRSIHIANVDYECTYEEIEDHFLHCGTVHWVTIPIDEQGRPKGYAYVAFSDAQAVENALSLHYSLMRGRPIKVSRMRTIVRRRRFVRRPSAHSPYAHGAPRWSRQARRYPPY